MDLRIMREGACLTVAVAEAEVDLRVSDDFRDAVVEAYERSGARHLLLDLGAVSFVDSKAIGAMVAIRKTVASAGGRVGLCGLNPHVAKLIRVVTLGTIFDVFGDREAGLDAYRA